MTSCYAPAVLFTVLVALAPAILSAPFEPGPEQNVQKETKPTAASLTGCMDEHDGRYILTDDRELKPIANLEADGFPQEGFAKHLGHKVTVRGSSTPGDPWPTFKVRSITLVNESCAPQR
jgi:hypothetical protein